MRNGARAVELGDQVQLHGYGDLAYERSTVDASDMRLGDREIGSNLSLVGIWQATDRSKVWAQLFRSSELGKIRVDWAFVDYQTTGSDIAARPNQATFRKRPWARRRRSLRGSVYSGRMGRNE